MTKEERDRILNYPHKDRGLFLLHCLYKKHDPMKYITTPKSWDKGLELFECSCGALFLRYDNLVRPAWASDMYRKNNTTREICSYHEARQWNEHYWATPQGDHAYVENSDIDAELITKLGLELELRDDQQRT